MTAHDVLREALIAISRKSEGLAQVNAENLRLEIDRALLQARRMEESHSSRDRELATEAIAQPHWIRNARHAGLGSDWIAGPISDLTTDVAHAIARGRAG